ncbi:putative anthocyanidin reductase isoform X2 [Dendrobium catenatum]|uniref:putative anthocyanidin reductase isoform X2 n=1 Tax=Dendrobium catenatum TaxID=906689 RepID=UPI0009F4FC08|nr:putative anthocyanidin reductase isoform X2 [Dendrobium catenatum]
MIKGKASFLLSLPNDARRLKIFKADLSEEGSFDEAVKGCVGVFHVAASMEFSVEHDEANEEYVTEMMMEAAVKGTINVLQACLRSKSVKRVVFTSSISTISAKKEEGGWRSLVDESSVNPIDVVLKTKPYGWIYVASKLITEQKAFQFAKENAIDLVSVIPPTVAGPFLTSSVPVSVKVILSPLTGDPNLHPIIVTVQSRLGSIPLVHIEDICNAQIFLMENNAAEGRYICSASSSTIPQLEKLLSESHPSFSPKRSDKELHCRAPSVISSKKLTNLGFQFKHSIKEIVEQSVASCTEVGYL